MRRTMTTLLCAGALLMTVAACADDDDAGASDETSSTTTSTTAPEPTGPKDIRDFGFEDEVPPGTYFIDPDGDSATPLMVTFEVAADGWSGGIGGPAKYHAAGHTALAFLTVDNVTEAACEGTCTR